jgi:hypothetical protein
VNPQERNMTTGPEANDPDRIQEGIARTRSELDETLTALESRLSPEQIMGQAKSYLQSNSQGGREFLSNLTESIRRNPVPMALIGIGMTWMMMAGRQGHASDGRLLGAEPYDADKAKVRNDVQAAARDVAEREGLTPEDHAARQHPDSGMPRALR